MLSVICPSPHTYLPEFTFLVLPKRVNAAHGFLCSSDLLNVTEERWRGESRAELTFWKQPWKIPWQERCFIAAVAVCSWLNNLSPLLFPSGESQTGRGRYVKRLRCHGKGMFGMMKISRCHYFVKLVEGPPPPPEPPKTGFDQAKEYVQQLRNRTLVHTLWHFRGCICISCWAL